MKRTKGASFVIEPPKGAIVVSKAYRRNLEAYSAFKGTTLKRKLRKLGVREL